MYSQDVRVSTGKTGLACSSDHISIFGRLNLGFKQKFKHLLHSFRLVQMARVRNQLRRVRPASIGLRLEYEDIILDSETHRVTRSDNPLKLGPTEFRLLSTFMEKPGRVWSREQLLDRVWGRDIYVDSRTVDVHVGRLRKALCVHGGEDPVRTVRGAGYALG